MKLLVISLLALFMSLMLVIGGNAFLLTYLGVRLGASGISASQVGIVMVCYSLGFAAGSYWCAGFVNRVGHIRTFAAFTAITAMASIAYPLDSSIYTWSILRFIGGVSAAGLYVIIESWFNAVASNSNRGTLFSLYQVAAYGSSTIAQLSVGLSSTDNDKPFMIAGIMLLAAIIPLTMSRLQSPNIEQGPRMSLLALYRQAPLGITTAICGGFVLGTYYSLVPLFGSQTGMSVKQVSYTMTASVLMALAFAWPVGWICDRIQRSQVLTVILFMAGGLSLLTMFMTPMPFILRLIVLAVLLGLLASVYSISVALTNDRIDSSARVAASSALTLSYGIGSIIGPLVISNLMDLFRPEAMFAGFVAILAMLIVYTRYRQSKVPPLPVAAQESFVATSPEGQVAPAFDPRSEYTDTHELEDLFPDEMVEAANNDDEESAEEDDNDESTADALDSDSTESNTEVSTEPGPDNTDSPADKPTSDESSASAPQSETQTEASKINNESEAKPASETETEEADAKAPSTDTQIETTADETVNEAIETSETEPYVESESETVEDEIPVWEHQEGEYYSEKEASLGQHGDPSADPEAWSDFEALQNNEWEETDPTPSPAGSEDWDSPAETENGDDNNVPTDTENDAPTDETKANTDKSGA